MHAKNYRKPTSGNTHLHFQSCHHPSGTANIHRIFNSADLDITAHVRKITFSKVHFVEEAFELVTSRVKIQNSTQIKRFPVKSIDWEWRFPVDAFYREMRQ